MSEPGTILDDGEALESGVQGGGPTSDGVFGYARLETGYVEPAVDPNDWPGVLLYGPNIEDVRDKAAVGITEEPGVDAVDFADKLLILNLLKKIYN